MKQIAWIGIGVMGRRQAGHLVAAGYSVKAYSRRFENVTAAAATYGFLPVRTIAEAVADADVIFTMVGYPADVEQVYLGEEGIFAHAKKGAVAVDMTTSSPKLAVRLYQLGQEKESACWTLLYPAATGELPKAHYPLWQAATKQILSKYCPFYNAWESKSGG